MRVSASSSCGDFMGRSSASRHVESARVTASIFLGGRSWRRLPTCRVGNGAGWSRSIIYQDARNSAHRRPARPDWRAACHLLSPLRSARPGRRRRADRRDECDRALSIWRRRLVCRALDPLLVAVALSTERRRKPMKRSRGWPGGFRRCGGCGRLPCGSWKRRARRGMLILRGSERRRLPPHRSTGQTLA